MFSNNVKKEVPKSIRECITTDPLARNLWDWAKRIEVLGKILCWIIIIAGICSVIITMTISMIAILPVAVIYGVSAFLEYLLFHAIALAIGALASIVQHTKISADIALYNCVKGEVSEGKKEVFKEKEDVFEDKSFINLDSDGSYICPKCKMSNDSRIVCERCGYDPND